MLPAIIALAIGAVAIVGLVVVLGETTNDAQEAAQAAGGDAAAASCLGEATLANETVYIGDCQTEDTDGPTGTQDPAKTGKTGSQTAAGGSGACGGVHGRSIAGSVSCIAPGRQGGV